MDVPLAALGADGDDDDAAGEPVGSVEEWSVISFFIIDGDDAGRKGEILLTHQEASWANSD